jgi:hypothetical protein
MIGRRAVPDIEIRLHIMPKEIFEFCKDVHKKYGIHFFAMTGQVGHPISAENLASFIQMDSPGRYLFFFTEDPTKYYESAPPIERNPRPSYFQGKLFLPLPRVREDGIEACTMSCRCESEDEFKIWKNVAADLKKIAPTHKLKIVSYFDGKLYPSRSHRISSGAISFLRSGSKLYEWNSESYYVLD